MITLHFTGGRYSIFPSGELHIKGASIEDGFKSYHCVTRNRLTGEMAPSAASGKLFVTGNYFSNTIFTYRYHENIYIFIIFKGLQELN